MMGVMNRFLNYLGLQEEEEVVRDRQQPAGSQSMDDQEIETPMFDARKQSGKHNVVSIHSQKSSRMILCEPRTYEEAQEIADHLKSRRSVVVNLQRVIKRDSALRIVDFLGGTVYALGGNIAKVGMNIFLLTPDSVEVSGTISELLAEDADYPKMR